MKKISIILFVSLCLFVTGCSNIPNSEPNHSGKEQIECTSEPYTAETDTEPVNLLSDYNIKELDLSQPENENYLQYKKDFTYNNAYSLPDGRKIIEDKNLYIEDSSENRKPLIEVSAEETEKYVVFWDMIDDDRFSYYIINHEATEGSGIYNLETGEDDYRIDICDDNSGYVPKKIVDNYLWFEKGRIADFRGFGKLNLDTYEFTEIDCSPLLNDNIYYWGGADISPDGTKAAIYGLVSSASESDKMNEYQVAIYSLAEEKILKTYTFFSENDYVNHQLLFLNNNQVYLFANQYGDNPKKILYIINLEFL